MGYPQGLDAASVGGIGTATNWQRVKSAGYGYVFLRACYGTQTDTIFLSEWPKLKSAGLVRGAYLFWRSGTRRSPQDPVAQAKAFIATLSRAGYEAGDLPPVLDIEFSSGRVATGYTAEEALALAEACWQTLFDHYGFAPMIYTSARVWQEDLANLPTKMAPESPLWLARYINTEPPVPQPWRRSGEPSTNGNWWVHQYKGNYDAKQISGFTKGLVDLNNFNQTMKGDAGERIKWVQRRVGVTPDGKFGSQTDAAVRTFQANRGLVADGIIGPKTFAQLAKV